MKMRTNEVKSKSKVVGEAEYAVYDSVGEATEGIGESTVLALVNAQVRTNALNEVRAKATGKPSKKALQMEALASATVEELQAVAGDVSKLQELINRKVAVLEAEEAAAAPAGEAVAPTGEDDDEDDE